MYVYANDKKLGSKRTQDPTAVTTSLVPFHVTPNAEGFAATGAWTFERFLARVRMAVDPEAGWS